MTFETLILNIDPLQEGNVADLLDLEFEPEFPLASVSEIECRIKQRNAPLAYLTKKLSEGNIVVTDQVMVVPLAEEDSKDRPGGYTYECDFFNAEGKSFFTITGSGVFNPEIK